MKRNCVYTGEVSNDKDKVIKPSAVGGEIHNWNGQVPCALWYKTIKSEREEPTDLELRAVELFFNIETAKLKLKLLELKLEGVQSDIRLENPKRMISDIYDIANHDRMTIQKSEAKLDEFFRDKMDMFDKKERKDEKV